MVGYTGTIQPIIRVVRIVAIIQARMGSSRFPDKMLVPLAKRPVIEWVLNRVSKAKLLDKVILATSDGPNDDKLCEFAAKRNISVYRGSETDVLGRICDAASSVNATGVVRICGDNPFIAPAEIDRLIKLYVDLGPDYAFNHLDRMNNNYADGFGAEILSMNLLEQLAKTITNFSLREHLTLAVWDRASEIRIKTITAPKELAFSEMRFDIDTPSDLERLEPLAQQVGVEGTAEEFVLAMQKVKQTREQSSVNNL